MISMDKRYQTRSGQNVTLYCVDADCQWSVHGYIEGNMYPNCWKLDGSAHIREHDLIPLPDWCEAIAERPKGDV